MPLHSVSYLLLLVGIVVSMRVLRRRPRARDCVLVLASYAFYGAWDPRFLALLVFTTAVGYRCGLTLSRSRSPQVRRWVLRVSLLTHLGILFVYKYLGFFVESATASLRGLGLELDPFVLELALPIGISFYTFQTLGYTIDVYRDRCEAEPDPIRFAAFVSFFPQLVAGPIERASDLIPQLRNPVPLDWSRWNTGWSWIGLGLLKKAVVADNLRLLVERVHAAPEPAPFDVYVGAFAFMAQLYFDVSAYTDIARGSARLLGIEVSRNFRGPFLAISPVEFWARWHITVTRWFSDYVFVAIGGSRPTGRLYVTAVLLTMAATGAWHGAAWTFIGFGIVHGVWIVLTQQLHRAIRPYPRLRAAHKSPAGVFVRWLLFLHGLALSGILFRAESIGAAMHLFGQLAAWSVEPGLGRASSLLGLTAFAAAVAFQRWAERGDDELPWLRGPAFVRGMLYLAALFAYFAFGVTSDDFVYDQF